METPVYEDWAPCNSTKSGVKYSFTYDWGWPTEMLERAEQAIEMKARLGSTVLDPPGHPQKYIDEDIDNVVNGFAGCNRFAREGSKDHLLDLGCTFKPNGTPS